MELSRLISISLDKISSETEGCGGGGSGRKNHEMDLRKALLVAHLIEQIQSCSKNNHLISELRNSEEYNKHQQQQESLMKELQPVSTSNASWTSDECSPSATVLQCVITNSESQTSKYCQYTIPVVCSVNTQQVMSSIPYDSKARLPASSSELQPEVKEAPEVVIGAEEVISSEDLPVSACCEVVSTPLVEEVDVSTSSSSCHVTSVVTITSSSGSTTATKRCHSTTSYSCSSSSSTTSSSSSTPTGPPLPKKKRPLPKEFLDTCLRNVIVKENKPEDEENEDEYMGVLDVSMEDDEDDDEEDYGMKLRRSSLEDYDVTPPRTIELQSMTSSSSVSTSCRPKVRVQVTDSARYAGLHSWNRLYMQQKQQQQQQPQAQQTNKNFV